MAIPLITYDDYSYSSKNIDELLKFQDPIGAFETRIDPKDICIKVPKKINENKLLLNVPVGVKDIFLTSDMPTRYGIKLIPQSTQNIDSIIVSRLKSAGAIIVGKTVTTECAFGASGKTRNPHDLSRTPGGSSSGSAAAVSARQVPLAVGSQTSGSIIRPAGYCGVWAIKPSYGCIPRTGMLELSKSFDHPGFFASNVEFIARAIDSTSGCDSKDPASRGIEQTNILSNLHAKRSAPRLIFLKPYFWHALDKVTRASFEKIRNNFCTDEIFLDESYENLEKIHNTIVFFESSRNLKKFFKNKSFEVSDFLMDRIALGLAISEDDYKFATAEIKLMNKKIIELFEGYDGIITPGTLGDAPKGLKYTGSRVPMIPASTFGLPVINWPIVKSENKLPVGLQIIGLPRFDSELVITAKWLESNYTSL